MKIESVVNIVRKVLDNRNLPVYILIAVCSSKWIFEGLLACAELQVFFLGIGVLILLYQKKSFLPQRIAAHWLIYIFSICFSVLISKGSINEWGRAALVALTLAYVLYLKCDEVDIGKIMTFLLYVGVFHAGMVLLHFIFKSRFTDIYFRLLNENDLKYALAYQKDGYFFGILTSPHEVAGLIVFAMMILLAKGVLVGKRDFKLVFFAALLILPLLLTGKKGILLCAVTAMVITGIFYFIAEKQQKKIYWMLGSCFVFAALLVLLVFLFPENPFFARFYELIDRIIRGKPLDSSRVYLYRDAISLWSEHKLFGIGWRQFKYYTASEGSIYSLAHQVNCDYLQWLCEMGVVGLALNLIPVLITLYRTVVLGIKGFPLLKDEVTKQAVLFAVCVQFYILLYAIVEIPFYDIMFFAIYILSCMIVDSVWQKVQRQHLIKI